MKERHYPTKKGKQTGTDNRQSEQDSLKRIITKPDNLNTAHPLPLDREMPTTSLS